MKGRFNASDLGIEKMPLKFYTRQSMNGLMESCGFIVQAVDWLESPAGEHELRSTLEELEIGNLEEVLKAFTSFESISREYVIKAIPATEHLRFDKLSEELMRARGKITLLEDKIAAYQEFKENIEAEYEKLALEVANDHSKITKDNSYIGQLETAIADRDKIIAEKTNQLLQWEKQLEEYQERVQK